MYQKNHPPLPSRKRVNSFSGPQGSQKESAGGTSGSSPVAREHRRPVTVTLTWHGRAEPWVLVEGPGWSRLVPPTRLVWELVLICNGWEGAPD